jgi:2-amino-4-hydroxy-6-hydroxymethyldihydropteridine diphosphokinase
MGGHCNHPPEGCEVKAVIALGSNLGDRLATMNRALDALARLPGTKLLGISRVYETDPVGYADQPQFLNAAVLVETTLSPHALLGACLGIEAANGRVRDQLNGPRTLDLDLIVYKGQRVAHPELTLPHPRMLERSFVLVPLADLFPDGDALGVAFGEELKKLGTNGITRLDDNLIPA